MLKLTSATLLIGISSILSAQISKDSLKSIILKEIKLENFRTIRGIGHMPQLRDGIIYAGKKNEVILVDSVDANKAINNTRQVIGRIPGINIVETEASGFTANGIATRGLNPSQSVEMNTRQNGYNISADVFGYNEAYYIPPMEAVSRIEMIRGASSLQFGSQFGGVVNYVLNENSNNSPLKLYTSQTVGSFGLVNTFNSISRAWKRLSVYGFMQYRHMTGWKPNSRQLQVSGFGRLQYTTEKFKIGLEYSMLRNKIQMPGGLTDSLFDKDPKISTRSRNWITTPWNIAALHFNYNISNKSSITIKHSYLFSSRSLVWRNEEGGPSALDELDNLTGEYTHREVEREHMYNTTTEVRLLKHYNLGTCSNTLSAGMRFTYAWFRRQGGGLGTTGKDFDLSLNAPFEYDLNFTTKNIAPFAENTFNIFQNKISMTPGFRIEHIGNSVKGLKRIDSLEIIMNENKRRSFPLFGIGIEYKTSPNSNIYLNISQAYRPIDYSQLTAFGIHSKIDPNLKDAYGYNADMGYRGTIGNYLNFDIGIFVLKYNKRIGVVLVGHGTSNEYSLRTNIANSLNKGIESYVEFNLLKYLKQDSKKGLSIFNSVSLIDATYLTGSFKGNRVEASTKYISRSGVTYNNKMFSSTLQCNNVGDAYGDASNLKKSNDPVAGYIPAYTVWDISSTFHYKKFSFKSGINNIFNNKYFTRRTDEYPGPGIIPSPGRSIYIGLSRSI